jgi:hypothetical protein
VHVSLIQRLSGHHTLDPMAGAISRNGHSRCNNSKISTSSASRTLECRNVEMGTSGFSMQSALAPCHLELSECQTLKCQNAEIPLQRGINSSCCFSSNSPRDFSLLHEASPLFISSLLCSLPEVKLCAPSCQIRWLSVLCTMLTTFYGRSFHPHGILLSFLVQLGGNTVEVDVEVVDEPLDYNLLLGNNWN